MLGNSSILVPRSILLQLNLTLGTSLEFPKGTLQNCEYYPFLIFLYGCGLSPHPPVLLGSLQPNFASSEILQEAKPAEARQLQPEPTWMASP